MHPNIGISTKGMSVMNSYMNDMFERLAGEASCLCKHIKRETLQARDVEAATKLLIPGELGKHAVSEGVKALQLYHKSQLG